MWLTGEVPYEQVTSHTALDGGRVSTQAGRHPHGVTDDALWPGAAIDLPGLRLVTGTGGRPRRLVDAHGRKTACDPRKRAQRRTSANA